MPLALAAAAWLAGCATPTRNGADTPGTVSTAVPVEAAGPVEPAQLTAPPSAIAPPVLAPLASRLPRVGLALGGGAARGFAHIGVIQVLEEAGITVDIVAGTSAGSMVATLYAAGKNGTELALLSESMDEATFADWSFPLRGVIRGEALARYVRQQTGGRKIEDMKRTLGIVATDLGSGQGILFQRGDPGVAVRASSAVPAVFQPVAILGREYVDGGLVAPVPVRYARQMGADIVIAVDISAAPDGNATGDAMRMLLQTFAIMGRSINTYELREADVVLRPKLPGVGGADFTARKRAIAAGREAMTAALADLRARLAARSR